MSLLIVDRWLRIEMDELSPKEWKALERKLTYLKPNGDIVISYRKMITRRRYILPRGAWSLLPDHIRYVDERTCPKAPAVGFTVKLDDIAKDERFAGQEECVETMFREEQGLIIRPPGTGKTQIALAFAARCKTRVLVLVHTEDILKQWVEYVETAMPSLKGEVGVIRGRTCKIGHNVTIATVQTLNRSYANRGKDFWGMFGAVIVDEAHHAAASSWENILNACTARYRFGFTASPTRADGMHPTMRHLIGPVIHRQEFSSPVKLEVRPIRTEFRCMFRGPFDWMPLLNKLVTDRRRNEQIAAIVDDEIAEGNSVLVLSRRIEHLERIAALVFSDVEVLAAKTRTKADRQRIIGEFRDGTTKCILATQLADEALDIPRLNRVCLVHPGKHEGRIIQQIGRALRRFPDKDDAVIYDFVDWRVGVLRRQWDQRKRTYKKERINVRQNKVPRWRLKIERV